MLGERYFATRERLREVIDGIAALAAETRAETADSSPGESASLDQPFEFLVLGEVNAGKSSLLNALFGREFCRVGPRPDTGRIRRYTAGATASDREIAPGVEECQRPLPFLKDFQLIDTPGTNSAARDHLVATEAMLPNVDLILAVFPVGNPWEASVWEQLARLDEPALDRTLFVVQQCDRREPADVAVILGHLRDLSLKRLGRVPPVFPVSAVRAMEAKRFAPPAYAPWQASGFGPFEDHISRHVCQSPRRRKMLDRWRKQAAATLQQIEERMDETMRAVDRSDRFLAEIEREIDQLRQRFVLGLPRHLAGVTGVFQAEAVSVAKQLSRRLAPFPTLLRLFTGDRSGAAIEALFIARLQAAVETVATQDATETVEVCRRHRGALTKRVRDEIGVELEESTELDAILGPAKEAFVQRLGRAARHHIGTLKVRHGLEQALRLRRASLKSLIILTLAALITAGIGGTLQLPWAPLIALGLAGFTGLMFVGASLVTRHFIVNDFRERLLATCGSFAIALRGDYEEALRVFFQDYTGCLGEVKRHLARQKFVLEPRMQRWNGLFLALKAVEQEL